MNECPDCHSPNIKKFGFGSGGRQRFKCKECGRTVIPEASSRIKGSLPPAQQEEIKRLLSEPGATIRSVATLSGHANDTVAGYAKTIILPDCPCGEKAGHLGWCSWRYARSEKRQAYHASRTTAKPARFYEPSTFYLGFMRARDADERFTRPQKCNWLGCVFPAHSDLDECWHHLHYFDYGESMMDTSISAAMFMVDEEDSKSAPPLTLVSNDQFEETKFRFEVTRAGDSRRQRLGAKSPYALLGVRI